ncbi:MAG: glycosyltransferase [Deltaproteobacteria bacterium]|nr:glycosyltransferase [Deltaproteobacteria bacterium]
MSGLPQMSQEHRAMLFRSLRDLDLSVIVPVFNEAKHIKANLDLLLAEVVPYFSKFEILVVSDGSTDGTAEVLQDFIHPQIKLIAYEKNHGKGYAIREGFKRSQGDFVLFIDGGMELHPREIRIFLGLMELYDADVVVASKRHPQSQIDYPTIRRILSFIYQLLIRYLFKMNVTDTQVGLKLFKRDVIRSILPHLCLDRYGADLEILALARAAGYQRFLEAPVRLDYFRTNSRPFLREMFHIFRVGSSVLLDTLRLYGRIRKLTIKPPLTESSDHDIAA